MNISFWKNPWYIVAFLVIPLIVFIAYKSTSTVTTIISLPGQPIVAVEIFLRTLFNPLWILFLWFCDKGRKMNSEHHHDILNKLLGIAKQASDSGQKKIQLSTMMDILFNSAELEKKLKDQLAKGVNMNESSGSPTL